MKKAFTLAEIMIVLVIIGVITAILLPVAINSAPDENVMKFKKANNTLGNVIREFVNSDKYYANGDLGLKADGTSIYDVSVSDWLSARKYFCETFADLLNTKYVKCDTTNTSHCGAVDIRTGLDFDWTDSGNRTPIAVTEESIKNTKLRLDSACKDHITTVAPDGDAPAGYPAQVEIVTNDGISWWETNPTSFFGHSNKDSNGVSWERFSPPDKYPANFPDQNGFDGIYKVICFDVDEVGKGEDPFGYGIRRDGKILTGARADEWLNKSVQKGD